MQILLRANLLDCPGDPRLKRFFPAGGNLFKNLLEHCRQTGKAITFLRDMRWSPQHMQSADAFLVARAQTLAQPQALLQRQTIPTRSKWGELVTYRASNLKACPPPGSFRLLDQWTNELLASTDLDLSRLRGVQLVKAASGAIHVQVQQVLGPVAWDETMLETWDDGPAAPSTPRHRGTLGYPAESLGGDWDLARTAEPFGCNRTGQLVVSRRFYQWWIANCWKGLHFWPVWCETSPFIQEHRALWQDLMNQLKQFPRAELWC